MNPSNPLYRSIFEEKLSVWQPDQLELADTRTLVQLLFYQGTRPAKRSDTLGAAFTALSQIEGIYERLCAATLDEYILRTAEPVDAAPCSTERADAGEDSNSRRGAGS